MASTVATDASHQEEFVYIEWKEYGEALRAGLWKLFAEQHLVDVCLSRCSGLKVHKFILAMFFGGLSTDLTSRLLWHQRAEECEIGINDLFGDDVECDAEVVRQLFEFCYSGKISVATHNLRKVLSLAEAVKFRGLVDSIQKHYDGGSAPRPIKEELIIEDEDCEESVDQPDNLTSSELACGVELVYDRTSIENGGLVANQQPSTNNVDAQKPRKRSSRKGTPVKITYIRQTRSRANQPVEQSGRKTAPKKIPPKKKVSAKQRRKSESSNEEESSTDDVGEPSIEPHEDESSELESALEEDDDDFEALETSKKIKSTTNNRKRPAGAGRKRTTTTTTTSPEKYPSGGKKRVRLTCDQCDYTTTDKVTYANHLAKHDPSMDVKRFECDVCSKTFRSRKGFKCHLKTHGDPDEQFQCAQCPFSTPQKWSWRQHMAVMHKLDAESGRELIANFRCEQCDFECVAGHQLKAHLLRKHSLEKQFKCTECTYETIYRSQLEKHVSVSHRKERQYMCEICGFRSQTGSGLTRHKRAHLGIKPFKCHCGMEYADRGKYKTHLLRHTSDEKPFVCHVCAHSCRRRDNLRMHLKRIHNLSLDNHNASRPFGAVENGQEQIASEAASNNLRPDGGDDGIRSIDSPTLSSYY